MRIFKRKIKFGNTDYKIIKDWVDF